MTSRRLPRWMGPDGLRPEATTTGFPGARRSAAAMTWSAIRETQSSSVSRAIRHILSGLGSPHHLRPGTLFSPVAQTITRCRSDAGKITEVSHPFHRAP